MLSSSTFIETLSLFFNEIIFFDSLIALLLLTLIYLRFRAIFIFLIIGIFVIKFNPSQNFLISYFLTTITFSFKFIRRHTITKPIIVIIKKLGLLPKISEMKGDLDDD